MDSTVIGTSLDWLGVTPPPATEDVAQPTADDKAPLATETAEKEQPKEPAAPVVEEKPADEPPAVPLIVDELGGEEGARQFIPLVRAIQMTDGEPAELGAKLHDALLKILTPDQYSSLSWTQYEKYGLLMTEQYLADNPNFLKEQGFVKASEVKPAAEADDDLLDDDISPREKALQAQLAAEQARTAQQDQRLSRLEQKEKAVEQQTARQSQQTIVAQAEKAMLGDVVDKTFEKLEGWEDADIQKAVRYALSAFNADPKAVEQFKVGVKYQETKQPVLAVSQIKTQKVFEQYLVEGIEMVDAKRSQALQKKAPIPPGRTEFSTTTPASGDAQQPVAKSNSPFDPNMLMNAVQERLRAKAAN